jgi:hypothetical protein
MAARATERIAESIRHTCEHMFVHAPALRSEALRLAAAGVNDCEIARQLGVARTTVRDWRAPSYVPRERELCPRCWRPSKIVRFTAGDYAELLGLYLGDGCISATARTHRLRIVLDAAHPVIIADTIKLLQRCFPQNQVDSVRKDGGSCFSVSVYSQHLPCLLPQAAPGKKHDRPIVLEPWQLAAVAGAPWRFLRGCIRSDGCTFVNRTGPYEYLSYSFANKSTDILVLFEAVADSLGLRPRRTTAQVRINRRDAVAMMRRHVGLKR